MLPRLLGCPMCLGVVRDILVHWCVLSHLLFVVVLRHVWPPLHVASMVKRSVPRLAPFRMPTHPWTLVSAVTGLLIADITLCCMTVIVRQFQMNTPHFVYIAAEKVAGRQSVRKPTHRFIVSRARLAHVTSIIVTLSTTCLMEGMTASCNLGTFCATRMGIRR